MIQKTILSLIQKLIEFKEQLVDKDVKMQKLIKLVNEQNNKK